MFTAVDKLPIVNEFADPILGAVLLALIAATLVALVVASTLFPHHPDAYGQVMQIAGGLLLVLGVYYASVTVRELRAQQYLGRLSTLIGLLASHDEAVRVGTVRLLQSAALETPVLPADSTTEGAADARRRAIYDALSLVSKADQSAAAKLAGQVCRELAHQGFTPSTYPPGAAL